LGAAQSGSESDAPRSRAGRTGARAALSGPLPSPAFSAALIRPRAARPVVPTRPPARQPSCPPSKGRRTPGPGRSRERRRTRRSARGCGSIGDSLRVRSARPRHSTAPRAPRPVDSQRSLLSRPRATHRVERRIRPSTQLRPMRALRRNALRSLGARQRSPRPVALQRADRSSRALRVHPAIERRARSCRDALPPTQGVGLRGRRSVPSDAREPRSAATNRPISRDCVRGSPSRRT